MTGYRNNPAANQEVFYEHEGRKFFRTGDVGKMVEGKFLKITGACLPVFLSSILLSLHRTIDDDDDTDYDDTDYDGYDYHAIVDAGRIKEQFKLENGKFVVPAPLEDVYTRSPFIAQIFITGKTALSCSVL